MCYTKFAGCFITSLWSGAPGEHRRRVKSLLRSDSDPTGFVTPLGRKNARAVAF